MNERIRAKSKALFGARYRLELAAGIAGLDPGVFYLRQLAAQCGLADNVVHLELRHFEEAGIVTRLPRVPGQRGQYFERLPSPYWELAKELLRDYARETR